MAQILPCEPSLCVQRTPGLRLLAAIPDASVRAPNETVPDTTPASKLAQAGQAARIQTPPLTRQVIDSRTSNRTKGMQTFSSRLPFDQTGVLSLTTTRVHSANRAGQGLESQRTGSNGGQSVRLCRFRFPA